MKCYAFRTNFVTWCQCCSIHRPFWIFMQMCFGHYPNYCERQKECGSGEKYCDFFYALHILTNIVDVHSEWGCQATAKLMKAICDALHSVCSFNRRTFPKWNYFKPTFHSKATFRIENVSITSDKHKADGWLSDCYRLKWYVKSFKRRKTEYSPPFLHLWWFQLFFLYLCSKHSVIIEPNQK